MRKLFSIAKAEYLVAVKAKAFIVGVLITPLLMFGGLGAQALFKDQVDKADRRCVIVDRTGALYPLIESANEWRSANEAFRSDEGGQREQVRPLFFFEAYDGPMDETSLHASLSARVRTDELLGYAIIGGEVLDTEGGGEGNEAGLAYHTKTPSDLELAKWLEYVVNREARRIRFEKAGLDEGLVRKVSKEVRLASLGLVEEAGADGAVAAADSHSQIRTFAIPIASMVFIFMVVMMTAPVLLNQVLEEKIQKISEVLIASVSPFELLIGKLLGTMLVALTLAVVYLVAIYAGTRHFGIAHMIDPVIYPWMFLFLVLSLLMYGSMFSAIGAACNEIKDAQSLMTPAMLLIVIPFFAFGLVVQSPNSPFATALSLFPPATPMIMMLRIALEPGPPVWQLLLGVALTLAFAVGCVGAAGKIFRIGILSRGQAPTLLRLAKWLVAK